MPAASSTHLVLIPSYNPGPGVVATVRAARAQWTPVWVLVDGSSDGDSDGILDADEIRFGTDPLRDEQPAPWIELTQAGPRARLSSMQVRVPAGSFSDSEY